MVQPSRARARRSTRRLRPRVGRHGPGRSRRRDSPAAAVERPCTGTGRAMNTVMTCRSSLSDIFRYHWRSERERRLKMKTNLSVIAAAMTLLVGTSTAMAQSAEELLYDGRNTENV